MIWPKSFRSTSLYGSICFGALLFLLEKRRFQSGFSKCPRNPIIYTGQMPAARHSRPNRLAPIRSNCLKRRIQNFFLFALTFNLLSKTSFSPNIWFEQQVDLATGFFSRGSLTEALCLTSSRVTYRSRDNCISPNRPFQIGSKMIHLSR